MALNSKLLEQWIHEIVQNEMAIANYKTVGDFSKRSSISSQVDRDLVTHPKGIEKIKRQWQKTPFPFDIYVINDPRVNKPQFREVGVVEPSFIYDTMKLTPEEIPLDSNHISILFTNNVAAAKIPLTGWTMAHRLGHTMQASRSTEVGRAWNNFADRLRKVFDEIMEYVYSTPTRKYGWGISQQDKVLKYVAQEIGTMKAARDKKLRTWYEFAYELLAQYLITGKITLNPLPRQIVIGIRGWGHKDYAYDRNNTAEDYNEGLLSDYAEELEQMLSYVLSQSIGEVFVM